MALTHDGAKGVRMGFGDKLKDLTQQAKEKVAENREKIQDAVDAASAAADEKTHGKYANKIMKVNQKTGSALDKFSEADGAVGGQAQEPSVPVGDPPRFGDASPEAATGETTAAATSEAKPGPKFDDEL